MKSKLIRILIVFCFIGMVVFGAVVLLTNFNVGDKVYIEITTIKTNAKFDALYKRADSVQSTYASDTVCPYVDFVNDAIKFLNEGIDYYLYYFQDVSNMNSADKNNILKAYKEYIEKINTAKSTLAKYESFESKTNPTINDKTNVAASSARFAMDYLIAYSKGYEVFNILQDTVNRKIFGGDMYKSFAQIKYEMASIFVNNSADEIVSLLKTKAETGQNSSELGSGPYTLTSIKDPKNFFLLYQGNKLTNGFEFRDQNHSKFVSNYDKISNPKAFLTDSSTYIAENDSESSYCISIKTFLKTTYGIEI